MSGDKIKHILTIDHANKQREIGDVELYRHWVKQVQLLRAAREQHCTEHFRRDISIKRLP